MAQSNENNSNQQRHNTDNIKADSPVVMLYSFPQQGKGKWRIQNDVVMGGRSNSQLQMTADNNAHFSGSVSLENNGGFCSIHQTVEKDPYNLTDEMSAFVLRLNGDGKDYNFRVRTPNGRHLYGYTFSTKADGQWETVSIPFKKMEAKYHGEPVDVPNYAGENVVEMQLLIGNNKEETFEILIESIAVH
ncbi:CIA30 family protein [Winogradskyella forsetii]|uniref:CIA30 family protein n=1 Tax=Winogradskyella forsetii TaxID=2686077 RepID=UPI0015B9CC6F|nr:CIA30 family protein [Winogradskyella forsetii]